MLTRIHDALESTGLPVAYGFFREAQEPPFLVYLLSYSNNFDADDRVFHKRDRYNVELYVSRKSPDIELLVEDALDEAELVYDKNETFIREEQLFQTIYTIYER